VRFRQEDYNPRQDPGKNERSYLKINYNKNGWWSGSSVRALA
jgi:hypothetical protein